MPAHRETQTACSRPSSSRTSPARRNAPPSSATRAGASCSRPTTRRCAGSSTATAAVKLDTAGDGFFATFDGPARAIRCASAIRDDVRSLGLQVRAGLHTGECQLVDGKVGGIAVHIGARVASVAAPGEVLVSSTVKDLVAGSGIVFEDRGEQQLKGLPDAWHLFKVVP